MKYQDALDWIHGSLKFGIKPGIKRMEWLLEQLGNPQKNICAVHIVGTNGKGSTTNNLQHIFRAADYEVGTFTSPYIMDFRERIAINGQMIEKDDLVDLVTKIKPVVERLPLETDLEAATEFEIITLLMFVYFGQVHPVDLAFIEAGLGGLTDSTNLFKAQVVICTSIGLDHQAILGDSYEAIASQKIGVLKEGVPLVFAEERETVRKVFYAKAKGTQSPVYELGKEFAFKDKSDKIDFVYGNQEIRGISLAMPGQHQKRNAALAIMTSLLLAQQFPALTPAAIKTGLAHSRWLGRTEFITDNLMIDGAHNNESVAVLVDLLKASYADRKIHILFAAIHGKPIDSMLEQLDSLGDVTVTSFDFHNALDLAAYPKNYRQVEDFQTWLEQKETAESQDLFVITGSLYFIAQVRQWLLKSDSN